MCVGEFQLWHSMLRICPCLWSSSGWCWGVGLIPSLEQWVKDLGIAQLWHRLQLLLGFSPCLETSICHARGHKKKKLCVHPHTYKHVSIKSWGSFWCCRGIIFCLLFMLFSYSYWTWYKSTQIIFILGSISLYFRYITHGCIWFWKKKINCDNKNRVFIYIYQEWE